MNGCRDFNRTERLRQGTALPGNGLPAVEPGMPIPAGTGLTRRSVLLRGAGLALSVYGAGRIAPAAFEEGIAQAAAGPAQPVIVSIFLPGGIDSLSVLAPVTDPKYTEALRPTLHLSEAETLAMNGTGALRWHPAAEPLKTLHDAGKVTVCPAIGYASPNQSHFTSRHFWEVGELDPGARTGWLGRYLDLRGELNNPIQGLSLNTTLSPSLATQRVAVAAASSPTGYAFDAPGVTNATVRAAMAQQFGALGGLGTTDPILGQARQVQRNSHILRGQLQTPQTDGTLAYPAQNTLAGRLKSVAGLLAAGLPLRVVTIDANGGYDTHASQANGFAANLGSTCQAIAAFQSDLESRPGGLADRVLIHLWSEFGRRPGENGSQGTDHGAAGVSFVIGTRASGQFVGEFPGLSTLDTGGNLRSTSDFRAVYCSLLEQWLGADARDIIPGAAAFARPTLVS